MIKSISNILLLAFLVSCVGTIEESPKKRPTVPARSNKLSFSGISSCKAVSHDKIEVLFKPAEINFGSVGKDDLVYQAYINGSYDKVSSSGRAGDLLLDSSGFYHLLVNNLSVSTNYKVSIRVMDPITGQTDVNVLYCEAKTDADFKPVFDGLQSVVQYPGVLGETTALLRWNEAIPGKFFLPGVPDSDYKIESYKIYFGESENKLIEIASLDKDARSYTMDPQTSPPGPIEGKTFYFKVKAVDREGREERNEIIRPVTFKKLGSVSFGGVTEVKTIQSVDGFSALDITWETAEGRYNIYKTFVIPNKPTSEADFKKTSIDPNDETYYYNTITDTLKTDLRLQGLSSDTQHKVFVVACLSENDRTCLETPTLIDGQQKGVIGTTTPDIASFGGITGLSQPNGQLGLTQFNLLWNPPTNEGICSEIKVRDVYNDRQVIPLCSTGTTEICLEEAPTCTSTGVVVRNAVLDQKYCVEAYVEAYGRQQSEDSIVTQCGQISFERPVFQDDFIRCNIKSASEIEITWDQPSPLGVFDNYVLFHKEVENTDPTEGSLWASNAKTHYSTAGAMHPNWNYELIDSDTFKKSFTGLLPNTNYTFMINTVADVFGTNMYDSNTVLLNCKTSETELLFDDWLHIAAFGPSVDQTGDGTIVGESIIETIADSGAVSDISYSSAQPGDGEEGNVLLVFKDFMFSDGTTFQAYLDSLGGAGVGDGYYLFRSTNFFPQDKQIEINNIDENNSNWQLVNPGAPILIDKDKGYVEIIDVVSGNVHPIKDPEITGSTINAKGRNGRLLNYAIRAKLNGKFIRLNPAQSAAAITQVILPPANMTLLHPWMVNKEYCERRGAEVDKTKNYRCEVSGGGTYEDPSDELIYFEEKSFSLIDSANLGKTAASTANLMYFSSTETIDSGKGFLISGSYSAPTNVIADARLYTSNGNGTGRNVADVSDPGWFQNWADPNAVESFGTDTCKTLSSIDYDTAKTTCFPGAFPFHITIKDQSTNFKNWGPAKPSASFLCGYSPVTNVDAGGVWDTTVDQTAVATSARPAGCPADAVPVTTFYEFPDTCFGLKSGSFPCMNRPTISARYFYLTTRLVENPNTIKDAVTAIAPSYTGDFAGGKWMIPNSAVYTTEMSMEYFGKLFIGHSGANYGLGANFAQGEDNTEVSLPVNHGPFLCQSKTIGLRRGASYLPAEIRKRLITSKEANFVKATLNGTNIANGTVLNDQFLCQFSAGKYSCSITPTPSLVTSFESVMQGKLSFPFSAYNLFDRTLPDQGAYIDADGTTITLEREIVTDIGPQAAYSLYTEPSNTTLYSTQSLVDPMRASGLFRCAVKVTVDDAGIIQQIDDRN